MTANYNKNNDMGMMKHYHLALICLGDNFLEQEAIEWALVQGWFEPKFNFAGDKAAIEQQLPDLLRRFQAAARENEAVANAPMQELIHSISHL